eukprot:gnl/MRDRNA2_/MRDRNA2_112757_c0_seq1.p1 gnl/MRDRNA2_/MRDRNA2_112757_c0~~gnl/MRDRNA2_/MRDRNA2_112757_c0_seq1.p1  ORF type:complete len:243 (+),score=85.36 gnl/MRDRNA2_/MRDRNA2_112757_c0_seq1:144-872(+)
MLYVIAVINLVALLVQVNTNAVLSRPLAEVADKWYSRRLEAKKRKKNKELDDFIVSDDDEADVADEDDEYQAEEGAEDSDEGDDDEEDGVSEAEEEDTAVDKAKQAAKKAKNAEVAVKKVKEEADTYTKKELEELEKRLGPTRKKGKYTLRDKGPVKYELDDDVADGADEKLADPKAVKKPEASSQALASAQIFVQSLPLNTITGLLVALLSLAAGSITFLAAVHLRHGGVAGVGEKPLLGL